jgi:hypothetical protein
MRKTSIAMVLLIVVMFVHFIQAADSAGTTRTGGSVSSAWAAGDDSESVAVGDRYLVPNLPASVVDQLPAAERASDRYLAERIAVADMVIGERILAAEDLANDYAQELPGFTEVLLADGLRQDTDGTWFYDAYSSWMRFPLNR